jgi:hypothetical protein
VNLALCLLTCDKPELVEQSIKPLLAGAIDQKFHLFVIDGSTSKKNEKAIWHLGWPTGHMIGNVRGGAGAAIVYALTMMLEHKENYSHVALVESDVVLLDGWLRVLDLFSQGEADGLSVGAASARCYVDRVLFQRDTYAVVHNIGAGMIVLTRQAAQIVLDTFRTGWTSDNRRIFSQLSGIDIGSFWAFRNNEHYLTADWHWEAALAAQGLAAVALTPSPVEMIGQNPPLAEQGLELAAVGYNGNPPDKHFGWYRGELAKIREGYFQLGTNTKFHFDPNTGTWTYFPHQMAMLGGTYVGDWRLQEARGWGTFVWRAGEQVDSFGPSLVVPVFGACAVLVSGGKQGGKVEIVDEQSGFKAVPELQPEGNQGQVLQVMVPGGMNYRNIHVTALTPGVCFYGIQTRDKQPFLPNVSFTHAMLPTP